MQFVRCDPNYFPLALAIMDIMDIYDNENETKENKNQI